MSQKRVRKQQRRERRKRIAAEYSAAPTGTCDFCCSAAAAWAYPCAPFTLSQPATPIATVVVPYHGDWLACDRCRDLIEAGEWGVLAEYSVVRAIDSRADFMSGADRDAVGQRIRGVHAAFRKHRAGPARPMRTKK